MKTYIRRTLTAGLVGMGLVAMPGCEKFVEVENPSSLETDAIDPDRDASLLSQSVYTRFVTSLEYGYILGAWFTNHARVGDTFPTRNVVGQRNIPDTNAETNGVWNGLHTNLQFARTTIAATQAAGNTLDLARAQWVVGMSIMQMAEWFCEGTIAESSTKFRPKMTTAALLDSAINELTKVKTIVAGITSPTAEATNLATSADVVIARALLQLGRNAQASALAATIPAAFNYNIVHIDNSTQRALGNQIWSFSEARISLVVGPEFRTIATGTTQTGSMITGSGVADPRVTFTDAGRLAQDGELQFFRQSKFPNYGTAMRFASGLEARYIREEADQNTVTMLAFINTRRAAGNQPAYTGATTITALMSELMLQKSIDFWLEGHEMRDYRRNPTAYPFVLATGNNYYKPSLGPVGGDACWPVNLTEKERNTEWNK
jgi:hypothetical protein